MPQRIELPLAGELLKKTGEIRVDVLAVRRESKHTVVLVIRHDRKLYQDRFEGTPEQIDQIMLERAGKDVFATVKPDGSDADLTPEIVSVEVVGND